MTDKCFFLETKYRGSTCGLGGHVDWGATRGLEGRVDWGPKWPQQGPVAVGHRQKSGARSAPDF
jgi:hypothetical protein